MRNVKNMFDDEYQGMGPVSLDKLSLVQTQEAEREKQRKLKRYLDNQKRNKKVSEANLDVPQLTDSMVSESSPSMVEQSEENTRPELKSGMDRYMPYNAPTEPRSEADVPMALPEPSVPYDGVFGDRNLKGQRYGLGISNEGSIPYESPSKYQSLGLMGTDSESAKTEDYGLDLPEFEKQKISSNQGMGSVGSNQQNSRDMLYDYLTNRRKSEPEFQQQYRNLSNDAETGRVLNTFASGLGEMASMAGTLGGKRADTGDMKALPNAIYGSMRKQADETLGLRRLENQEQVSDIRMLRDLEKGDLDNLRIQKILADLNRKKNQPKITPFFNFGDPEKNIPPSAVVMNDGGQFNTQPLPMGTMPTNSGFSAGPTLYDQQNNPILSQAQRSTGQYKFTPGPPGTKTPEIMRIENQDDAKAAALELSRLKNEMTNANAQEKIDLQRQMLELSKKIQDWKESQGNRTGDQADRRLDILEGQGDRRGDQKDQELDLKEKKNNQTKNAGIKTTEGERKNALFSKVLNDSLSKIEAMENGNPAKGQKGYRPGVRSAAGNFLGGTGSTIGNMALSDKDRLYDTMANNMIEPILRAYTGAAAQKEEFRRMWTSSKIMPGDDEATIKAKQKNRRTFSQGLIEAAGRAIKNPGSSGPRKPLSEMTREEKIRELQELEGAGS